jgi:predicted RNA-binding Zn-ribbon protein involved in translation (DUF1610 family)
MVMTEAPPARRGVAAASDPHVVVLTCPNCGAEVRIRRGDPAKTKKPYTCTCGTELEIPEDADDPLTWQLIA